MNYKILGQVFQINDDTGILRKQNVFNELNLYERTETEPDVVVNFVENNYFNKNSYEYNSPKIYYDNLDRELFEFSHSIVEIYKKERIIVNIHIKKIEKLLEKIYTKYQSMGFETDYDIIGQIFHEIILSIIVFKYFSNELGLIHGSVIYNKNKNNAFIISGVGGVGKTATEMNLLLSNDNFYFMADDIGFVDKNGYCYANFNFPKIYGYNAKSNPKINSLVKKNIKGLSKLLWLYRYKKNSQYTRRRISPDRLFGNRLKQKGKVESLYYLQRKNIKKLEINTIDNKTMAKILANVIYNEYYNHFFRYLRWHEIDLLLDKQEMIYDRMIKDIESVYLMFLDNIENIKIINLPYNFDLKGIKDIIIENEEK